MNQCILFNYVYSIRRFKDLVLYFELHKLIFKYNSFFNIITPTLLIDIHVGCMLSYLDKRARPGNLPKSKDFVENVDH